jgi:hypothetical protein
VRAPALKSALGLGLVCCVAWPSWAHAAPPSELELEVATGCERVDVVQLARLLDIEGRRRAESRKSRVEVSCVDGVVTLRVEVEGDTSLARSRDFAARDVAGEVGARVLSLAAVELLDEASRAPKPVAVERAAPPAAQDPLEPQQPTPSRSVPSVRLMAAGAVQSVDLARPLAGGGISVDFLRLAPLGLRLQLDVALGNRQFDRGTARLRLTTLSAQAGYLALHDTWTARAFVGYRFGTARIAGERKSSDDLQGTVAGAFGGPLLSSGVGMRAGSFVAELAAEAGLVSFPLRGEVDGKVAIALDGYWLGLSVNVGALL